MTRPVARPARLAARTVGVVTLVAVAAGCCGRPAVGRPASAGPDFHPAIPAAAVAGLTPPVADAGLHAVVDPPLGWRPDPPKVTAGHRHQTWVSPSGDSAYGVIWFKLPLPVGPDLALWGFMRKMRQMEGEARLLDRRDDPALPGIRFTAAGGPYTVRCTLTTDGLRGWVVYAGTKRGRPVRPAELDLAERARERTRPDRS